MRSDEASIRLFRQASDGAFDFSGPMNRKINRLNGKLRRIGLKRVQIDRANGIIRIVDYADAGDARGHLLESLNHFPDDRELDKRKSSDVTWAAQDFPQSRILKNRSPRLQWNRASQLRQNRNYPITNGHDDIRFQLHEVRSGSSHETHIVSGPTDVELDVAPLRPSEFG